MSELLHVLIVEDLEDDALLVLRELRRDGFKVVWERVETADALRTALTHGCWDLLISDYCLPSFNAAAALQILKQSQLDIPFIVVSGTIGETVAVELMKAGASDYLMKGNLTRLPEAVRREVREAQIRAERQQAAIELDQTKERLQLAIEGSGIGLWDWSVQTGALTLNDRWAEMIGYTLPELEPISLETWQRHTHPDDLQQATLRLDQHCRQEIPSYACELRMRHKLGKWIWVLGRGKVVAWDASGQPLRMIGTHLDITDRKLNEATLQQLNQELEARVAHRTAALQQSEARLREAQQVARLGSWELDVQSRKLTWSAEIFNIFGLSSDQPEPTYEQLLQNYLPPDERERYAQLVDRAIEQGSPYATDLKIIRGDGSPGYIFVKAELSYHHTEQVHRLFGIAMDISDRKQIETQLQKTNEELARATRLKDEFLANMSHELRTPLTAILGMSEILKEKVFGELNAKQHQYIEVISDSGKHLIKLINDILDVSKISAGKLDLEIAAVSLSELCESSLVFVKQEAHQKQIQLTTLLSPSLLSPSLEIVELDERRMRQVLINLLNNAVKFTPVGGQVTLDVELQPATQAADADPKMLDFDTWIVFSVIDTGIGISPEDHAKLFQPFVQIDSSLNRHYEGTGLGLTLVKQLVELHGGSVSLTSQLGQGSCFTIRLPCRYPFEAIGLEDRLTHPSPPSLALSEGSTATAIATPIATHETSAAGTVQASQRPLILIAEDNQANIDTLFSYLEMHGYQLLIARDGQEAITLTQTHSPDLILMDIQMPKVDGLAAIQTIRQDLNLVQIPIIALTALAMEGDRERCLAVGANDYLAKPIRLKHLTMTIRQLLCAKENQL
jgi:PAS domain S-box-containing protein